MRTLTALAVLVLALSACSNGESDDDTDNAGTITSVEDERASLPACADVWQDGATLPDDYDGCMEGDMLVVAVTLDCTTGSGFTTFEDRMFARMGGVIDEDDSDSPSYRKAWNDCFAD